MKRAGIALIAVVALFVIVMTAPDPFGSIGPSLDRLLPPESDWVFWTDRVEEIPMQSAVLRHDLERLSTIEKASSLQADRLLHVLGILSSLRDHTLISGEIALAGALAEASAPAVSAPLAGVDRRSPSRIAWLLALWRPKGVALRRALRVVAAPEFFDRYVRDLLPSDWGVTVDEGIIEIADPEALWTPSPPVTGVRPPTGLFITVIRDLIVISTDRRRVRKVVEKVGQDTPSRRSAPLPLDAPEGGAVLRLAPRARHVLHGELSFLGVGLPLTFLSRLFEGPDPISPLEIRWHWHAMPKMVTVAFQGRKGLHRVPRDLPDAELAATVGVSAAVFAKALASTFGPDGRIAFARHDPTAPVVTLTAHGPEGAPRWTARGRAAGPRDVQRKAVEVLTARWRHPVRRVAGAGSVLAALLPATLHAHGIQEADGRITVSISIEPPAVHE